MKSIDISKLYEEVFEELIDQGLLMPSKESVCRKIENMHRHGDINLWDMTEQEIKFEMKHIIFRKNV